MSFPHLNCNDLMLDYESTKSDLPSARKGKVRYCRVASYSWVASYCSFEPLSLGCFEHESNFAILTTPLLYLPFSPPSPSPHPPPQLNKRKMNSREKAVVSSSNFNLDDDRSHAVGTARGCTIDGVVNVGRVGGNFKVVITNNVWGALALRGVEEVRRMGERGGGGNH